MSVVPYKNSSDTKKEQVAEMFDSISGKYDLLNHLLSGGIDIYWRRKALNMIKDRVNNQILDIATGTGDLAIEANKILKPEKIIGVDISEGMLKVGREKMKKLNLQHKIEMQLGDSEKLLFDDNTFENLLKGLTDMYRVTKQGGTCLIVEFSKPTLSPFKQFYWLYSTKLLPLIGKLVSKDSSAYSYLPESVQAFPDGKEFAKVFNQAGFKDIIIKTLTFGICSVYIGKK